LAVSRAGHEIADSIYLGDGIWDVKATKAVGIPMVGIGRGIARLSALGIDHAFRDYSDPDSIIGALQTFRS
jgi:phosphoglycolate phosphatase-like HAD superfamily hydrolase